MSSRYVVVVIAAATIAAASLPALSRENAFEGAPTTQSQAGARDAHRAPRYVQAQPETQRRDHPQPHADHRHGDRHWVNPVPDHRNLSYVFARPSYYGVPRAYYAPPVAYYGAAPRTYYYPYSAAYSAPALLLQPGDYLPAEYRSQQFVVADWEWRGLSAPPYGYQWMLLGPDNFALVALSTGQIVSIVAIR